MHTSTTPLAVPASQFEELSRELFIGFQRAAKMQRMATTSHPYPLLVLPPAEERLRPLPPVYQETEREAQLVH